MRLLRQYLMQSRLAYNLAHSLGDAKLVEEHRQRGSQQTTATNIKWQAVYLPPPLCTLRHKGVYLAFLRLFVSYGCSPHGMVTSPMIRILVASGHMTKSGRRRLMNAATGKTCLSDRPDYFPVAASLQDLDSLL